MTDSLEKQPAHTLRLTDQQKQDIDAIYKALAEARAQGMREAAEIIKNCDFAESYRDLWKQYLQDEITLDEMYAAAIERAAEKALGGKP